jgi:hypothetical protein
MMSKTGRITVVAGLGLLVLLMVAGVAVARTFDCTTTCDGTNERDVVTGNDKDQTFYLKAGSDEAYGRGGADTMHGDGGSDRMEGNNGPYEIRDRGGQGDDDRAFGDDGDDTINVADGDSNDYGSCGAGSDDTLRVGSRAERDKFTGCVKSTSTRITSAAR